MATVAERPAAAPEQARAAERRRRRRRSAWRRQWVALAFMAPWIIAFLVPLQVIFAIATATVLTRIRRGLTLYRTIFFLPSMVPLVAAALGFIYLLNPAGPVNRLLHLLHLPEPLWFVDPRYTKPGVALIGLWGIGQTMIIFLAALLDVPKQLYEAAEIEGANLWQRFRHVTL